MIETCAGTKPVSSECRLHYGEAETIVWNFRYMDEKTMMVLVQ